MSRYILKIYDLMRAHRGLCAVSFLAITSVLAALMLRLNFNEDISAFLPVEGRHRQALAVYQDISGASKILAIVQPAGSDTADADALVAGVDAFVEALGVVDTARIIKDIVYEVDLETVTGISDYVYANIPYFLTDDDYARIDSLLSVEGYLAHRLDMDKQLLMFPTSGLLSANLAKDPLNLFTPTVSRLSAGNDSGMEMYDGYIFAPDMSRAVVVMESPYGNSETRNNAALMSMLEDAADRAAEQEPGIRVHFIGGPPIAVGNAAQIKSDSVLSISIAAILIVALLVAVFRRLRNILLIVVSVGWGWLFAMAMLSVVHDSVSLIVVGISSIILGIAVNYPLHFIAHTDHAVSLRQALREIVAPLIIGNITTVGAFLALVPIKASALRDLGIFSALILVGTILFTILYLPHCVSKRADRGGSRQLKLLASLANMQPERHKWLLAAVAVLTVVFAYFSFDTGFDADMSHINYMTSEQKADLEYLHRLNNGVAGDKACVYVVSEGETLDDAMEASALLAPQLRAIVAETDSASLSLSSEFLPSIDEQRRRLERWDAFVAKHRDLLTDSLPKAASGAGFSADAFSDFSQVISGEYAPIDADGFGALSAINSRHVAINPEVTGVVDLLYVPADRVEMVKSMIDTLDGNHFCFDVRGMNSAIANGLSDNFNYIGWACGLIVFMFLWFSFGSIELAMLSFLPMAVSWVWILGIMGVTGIQFNIVNIILATFIFGQGDDYTIFMTEGCCYEYATRRKMLASYKTSIIISALIMFIGIGTLIVAKHPALRSLAEVTVVGMFSVVLMAFLLPPVVFNWITRSGGHYRKRPLTIGPLLRTWVCGAWWLSQLSVGYVFGAVYFAIFGRNSRSEAMLRRFVTKAHRLDLRIMPGVKFNIENPHGENLERPCVIVCNHQSMLDPMLFMAWSPKILIVANERSSLNPIVSRMFRWLRFYTIRSNNFTAWKDSALDRDLALFRQYVAEGYSIVFFPEGLRNPDSSIVRYHKGPFYLARELGVDILPVLLHGLKDIMPKGSFACYKGSVTMRIGERLTPESPLWRENFAEMTRVVRAHMISEYRLLRSRIETPAYFTAFVIDRYRYKGAELLARVKRSLKAPALPPIPETESPVVEMANTGYGETALLAALVYPDVKFVVSEPDDEVRDIARYAAEGVAPNLTYVD